MSFARLLSSAEAKAVTYERGVKDLTESCGTGSVAVAVAFTMLNHTDPVRYTGVFRVHNPGGVNEVRLSFDSSGSCHAWLKGKTAMVARGQVCEDVLCENEGNPS